MATKCNYNHGPNPVGYNVRQDHQSDITKIAKKFRNSIDVTGGVYLKALPGLSKLRL